MARTGWNSVRTPTVMSTVPTMGMSLHAHASGMPRIAKYGSHAALVMTPKAPWPMKQAATATRRIQWSTAVFGVAASSLVGSGDGRSRDLPLRVVAR